MSDLANKLLILLEKNIYFVMNQLKLICWKIYCLLTPAWCHGSCVMFHVSYILCHALCVMYHLSPVTVHVSPVTDGKSHRQRLFPLVTPPLCTVCWFAKIQKPNKKNQNAKDYWNGKNPKASRGVCFHQHMKDIKSKF